MADMNGMVGLLSQDVGDYWRSTTTSAGSTSTVVDTALINEDNNEFVTPRCQVTMLAGAAIGETVGITSKSGATLTAKTGMLFGASSGSGNAYEVHRLFTRLEKEAAVNRALAHVYPILFRTVQEEVTIVADQHEYTLTNFDVEFQPSAVTLVNDSDSEIEHDIFAWEIRADDGKLYLPFLPAAGRTLRVVGILPPAITHIGTGNGEDRILSAAAAIELASYAKRREPLDQQSFLSQLENEMRVAFRERQARFGLLAPGAQRRTDVHRRIRDHSFFRA